jgi:hypothetical protein
MTRLVLALALVVTPSASAKFVFLQTPSHNIACAYSSANLLRHPLRPEAGARKPPGCQNDWKFGYQVGPTGRARKVCAGDSVFSPGARVIRYGTTWRGGPFACKSSRSGLRCRNQSGRGFFLSRQHSYRF